MTSVLDKLVAVARRDLLSTSRYRSAFLVQAVTLVFELAGLFFLARAVGPSFRPEGIAYYPYLLVGTALSGLLVAGITAFVTSIHEAQLSGTMEVLMTTNTSPILVVVLTAFSTFAGRAAHMAAFLLGGFLLFSLPVSSPPNIVGSVAVFILSLLVAVAVGVMAAAIQVLMQRGMALVWLFGSMTWLFSGTMFPVAALPAPMRAVAGLIPITYSLRGMRMALLQGASFRELLSTLGVLAIFCATLLPLSLAMFSWTIRRARLEGTLSFY